MKKKLMWIISWIALIILILFGFFAYKEMRNYTNIIKLNWWIQIPKEANVEEIYSKDSWESFHWDGIRYHVYSYEDEEEIESMIDWQKLHSEDVVIPTVFYDSYMEAIINWLNELEINDEYVPLITDFESVYYEKKEDNSEIIIIKSKKKILYVIESFL